MLRDEQITRLKERTWQWEAKESVEKALDENQRLFAINACVGSGKTNVAFEAMISFIEKFNPEKSVHLFVCPRTPLHPTSRDVRLHFKRVCNKNNFRSNLRKR